MSNNSIIELSDFTSLLAPYVVELKEFEILGNTPFRLNAFNGVYAPAKTGKTYFVLEQLNTLDSEVYHTIWLDGDRNTELKDKFKNIKHFPLGNPSKAFEVLLEQKDDFNNYIFVIDSFKDFTFGFDTDSNSSCQSILTNYQMLLNKGATLIVIFHATKIRNMENGVTGFKIKGNEDTIESKIDFMYKLERTDEYVRLTVQCARDINLKIGQEIMYCDKEVLITKIKVVVSDNPEISLRDLKRETGLKAYATMIDELEDEVYTTEEIKPKGGRGKPKQVVKLI